MARTVCDLEVRIPAETFFVRILDVESWTTFRGWGPIPGIRSARFRARTPEVVGSLIEVVNLDGSSHVEEVIEWQPVRRIVMRMAEFSPPLAGLASHFVESWSLEPSAAGTRVTRTFELHANSWRGRLVLPLVARLLGLASKRHLREMGARDWHRPM
jgi:hypothetical protein